MYLFYMKKLILSLFIFYTYSSIASVSNLCNQIDQKFKEYNWGNSNCNSYNYKHELKTFKNNPLIYSEFKGTKINNKNILILCGVHGDEITPIKFCFDALKLVKENNFVNNIMIAPIVAPEGFLTKRPTRTNGKGVDVNRNFPTEDWNRDALKKWKLRYKGSKRRFPGHEAGSEIETVFQMNLIEDFKPDLIISVHSPLTFIDYDGPFFDNDGKIHFGKEILKALSMKSKDYRIKDYPVYPGSLGNYAGKERKIPTYTLELPSSDPSKHKKYWDMFKESLIYLFNN